MNKVTIGVIVLIVLGGIAYTYWAVQYVDKDMSNYHKPEVIKEEVIVNPLDAQIKQRNQELEEAYRAMQDSEAKIDVYDAEIARLEALKKEEMKRLASFMEALASKNW